MINVAPIFCTLFIGGSSQLRENSQRRSSEDGKIFPFGQLESATISCYYKKQFEHPITCASIELLGIIGCNRYLIHVLAPYMLGHGHGVEYLDSTLY